MKKKLTYIPKIQIFLVKNDNVEKVPVLVKVKFKYRQNIFKMFEKSEVSSQNFYSFRFFYIFIRLYNDTFSSLL